MLPRTVKYRDSDRLFARRVFRVVKAEAFTLCEHYNVWKLTKANGAISFVPLHDEVHFGRKVEVLGEKPAV